MAESNATPPAFLSTVLQHLTSPPLAMRPHVTLTFAQSLDAKIAGAQGRQLILSGKESMIMTHWWVKPLYTQINRFTISLIVIRNHRMRTMHDAILVGINTAINDNPQLNGAQCTV